MVAFAVTFSDLLEKGGAYAGLAAFFGLAVLTVLYFAQARELKRLRDWAGRAPERAQELEQRVVEQAEQARRIGVGPQQPRPQQAATAAAKSAAKAKAKPKPLAKPAAAAAVTPPATASVTPASEASETAETEDPETADGADAANEAAGVTDPTATDQEIVAAKGEAAQAESDTAADDVAEGDAEREPVGATVARAAGAAGDPVAPPQPAAPPGQTGGNGAPPAGEIPTLPPRATPTPPPRRTAPAPAPYRPETGGPRRTPPARPALYDEPDEPRRRNGVLAAGAAAGLVLIVVAIIAIVGGGGNDGGGGQTAPPTANSSPAPDTGGSASTPAPNRPDRPARGDVRVLVLNGTSVSGLAASVDERVAEAGFASGGEPDNYVDQARSASQIFFTSPEYRSAANELGEVLTVSDIQFASTDLRGLVGPDVDVVVVVGSDQTP